MILLEDVQKLFQADKGMWESVVACERGGEVICPVRHSYFMWDPELLNLFTRGAFVSCDLVIY